MGDATAAGSRLYYPLAEILGGWPSFLPPIETADGVDALWLQTLTRGSSGPANALSSTLWFEQELALSVPGLDAVSLRLAPAPGTGTAVPFTLQASPTVQVSLDDLPLVLRVRSDYLRPAVDTSAADEPARFEPDPATEHLDIPLAEVSLVAGEDGLSVQGDHSVSLPLCLIGDTGIAVEADGIELFLDGDDPPPGKPVGWRGLAVADAKLYLPGGLSGSTGQLAVQDCFIGNGGFSGVVSASWDPALSSELFGIGLELTQVAVELRQNTLVESEISGRMQLPFFDEPLDVAVTVNLDGTLGVRASDDTGQATLTVDEVLELTATAIDVQVGDGLATVRLSGEITPLVMADALEWPTFAVDELAVDTDGNVHLEGGWLDLPEQHVLDFHGFQLEVTKLGFGKDDDGGKWVGFSGGLALVEGIQAGASVEGLRVTWYDDGDIAVTLDGVGVELEIPEVLAFKGAVSYTQPAEGQHEFWGAISLELLALDLTVDGQIVIGIRDDERYFAIYLDVGLPAGIPLWATGLSLYGLSGLVAVGMEPDRDADEGWFLDEDGDPGWYLKPETGVTDLRKWGPEPGSFALGAGITIGTAPDNGYAFNGSLLFVIVFPGPILLLDGRADILSERSSGTADDATFRALIVLDGRAGNLTVGLDGGYRVGNGGELIDVSAQAEAFYDFADASAWYVNLGERTPPERRIQATKFSLFQASGYVMLDPTRLAMGARWEMDEDWRFGPARLALSAYAEGDAEISFKPSHFHGRLAFGGSIEASIFRFGFLIALDAELSADVFTPFHIEGNLTIVLELPWPFSDWEREIGFEWGDNEPPPPLPTPVKEVAVEHLKATSSWPLARGTLLLPDVEGDDEGFLRDGATALGHDPEHDAPAPDAVPVVPLDARPRITFGTSVHDVAEAGVNPQGFPQPATAGWEWIGDPDGGEGVVKVRTSLTELTLRRRPASGGDWETVASTADLDGVDRLYGSWAPMPQLPEGTLSPGSEPPAGYTKLWLWSKTPFDHTRHGGRAWDDWHTDRLPSFPCVPPVVARVLRCDFESLDPDVLLGRRWECPEHPGVVLTWDEPSPQQVTVLDEPIDGRQQALCFPGLVPGPKGEVSNTLRLDLPEPASEVRIHIARPAVAAFADAFDVDGAHVASAESTDSPMVLSGERLHHVAVSLRRDVCIVALQVTLPPDPDAVEAVERMTEHLESETARWSEKGHVLQPDSLYCLRITTVVEAAEWQGAGLNGEHELEEHAYFRTTGPPALAELSPPSGEDEASSTGLEDLERYVRQTIPATVPPRGERPRLPRPVFRGYDVGVEFNEDYVDLLYRLAGRPLRLYLHDANDRPVRDAAGRLLVAENRWGSAEQLALDYSERRWVNAVEDSDCADIDASSIPHHVELTAGSESQVLDADTAYEARLVPLLLQDGFTGDLGNWEVVDEDGAANGPSAWAAHSHERLEGAAASIDADADEPAGTVIALDGDPALAELDLDGALLILAEDHARGHGTYRIVAADGAAGTVTVDGEPDLDGSSAWEIPAHGAVTQSATIGGDAGDARQAGTLLLAGETGWGDLRITVQLRSISGGALGVAVRHSDDGHYRFSMDHDRGRRQLVKVTGATATVLAEDDGSFDLDGDHLVAVEARGARLRVLVDGEPALEAEDDTLPSGRAGLYCWRDDAARFTDVAIDDLSPDAPVAYRFAFATSRYVDLAHHLHSDDERVWPAELPAGLDLADLHEDALEPTAGQDPEGWPADAETHAYRALADEAGAGLGPPERVEVNRLQRDGDVLGLWLRSPEPIDWSRTALTVERSDQLLPPGGRPGDVKLAGVTFGEDEPNDESVTLLLRDTVDLTSWQMQSPAAPNPLGDVDPAATLDAGGASGSPEPDDGVLLAETFELPGLDGWTVVDEPPYTIRESDWAVVDGELRERTNLYGFVDEPYGKPGTYVVAGDPAWSDYEVAVRLRSDEPAAIGVLFRYGDDDHYYRFSMNRSRGYRRLTRKAGGTTKLLWEDDGPVALGAWQDLTIRCTGRRLAGWLDGEQLFDLEDEAFAAGRVGLYCRANTGARFGQVRVEDARDEASRPVLATADAGRDVACRVPLPGAGADPLKVVLRRSGAGRCYRLSVVPRTGEAALAKHRDGIVTPLWKGDLSWAEPGTEVVVIAAGSMLRGFVGGVPAFVVEDGDLPSGRTGVAGGDETTVLEAVTADAAFDGWLLDDDFHQPDPERWTFVDEGSRDAPSAWSFADGLLRQTSNIHGLAGGAEHRPGTYALAGEARWADYRLSVRLRSDDDDAIGVMVRYQDADNYYRFSMDQERRYRQLIRRSGGAVTVLWQDAVPYIDGRDYVVTIDCIGPVIAGYVDGEPLFAVTDIEVPAGRIALYCWANDDSRFAEVRVAPAAWRTYHAFGEEEPLPAGTRVRVHAGSRADSPPEQPGLVRRFAGDTGGSGQPHFVGGVADLRLVGSLSEPMHRRRFLADDAYETLGVRLLRAADGTGFVVLPSTPGGTLGTGTHRLRFTYHRDNRDADPDGSVLRQAGDTAPERVVLDVTGLDPGT